MKFIYFWTLVLLCSLASLVVPFVDILSIKPIWASTSNWMKLLDLFIFISAVFSSLCAFKCIEVVKEEASKTKYTPLISTKDQRKMLVKEINEALLKEDYEKAAKLRDQLNKMRPNK